MHVVWISLFAEGNFKVVHFQNSILKFLKFYFPFWDLKFQVKSKTQVAQIGLDWLNLDTKIQDETFELELWAIKDKQSNLNGIDLCTLMSCSVTHMIQERKVQMSGNNYLLEMSKRGTNHMNNIRNTFLLPLLLLHYMQCMCMHCSTSF